MHRILAALWLTGCFVKPGPPHPATCTAPTWGAPTLIEGASSSADEWGPWMSADRLHLYFLSDRSGAVAIYGASRGDPTRPFDPPVERAELLVGQTSPPAADPEPYLSEDLKHIWYDYDTSDVDLVTASRGDPSGPFGTPSAGALDTVNTNNYDIDPSFTPDHTALYFSSNYPAGNYDIFVAASSDGTNFMPRAKLDALSSTALDVAPAVDSTNSMLLFESSRNGGRSILESDSIAGQFGPPVAFAPTDDGFANGSPYLLADDSALVYASDRGDGNRRDLYLIEACP